MKLVRHKKRATNEERSLYLHVTNLLNVNNEPPATLNANTPVTNVTMIFSGSVTPYIPLLFNSVIADTNK